MANEQPRQLVRIRVELDPDASDGSAMEGLWAEALGQRRYRIRNSPFYAFDMSNEDIVLCTEDGTIPVFERVLMRGGHSTYRLRLANNSIHDDQFRKLWYPLQKAGCTFEEGPVISVDVPPDADIFLVYALLEAGESSGAWQFDEGHCGHVPAA